MLTVENSSLCDNGQLWLLRVLLQAGLDYSTDNSNNGSNGNRYHGIIPPPGAARFRSVASDPLHGRSVAPTAAASIPQTTA